MLCGMRSIPTRRPSALLLALPMTLLGLGALGCSGGEDQPPASSPTATRRPEGGSSAPTKGGEERPIDPAQVGAIHGTVRFEGKAPRRRELGASGRAECQHEGVLHLTEDVIVNDGRLQNTYVYVKQGLGGWQIPPPPSTPAVLDQIGCIYTPHVLAIQVGTPLLVRNSDPTTHNVRVVSKTAAQNKSMGQGQADLSIDLTRPERAAEFHCDLHSWMKALVFVEEHPFFAVSDAAGLFAIEGLPPGTYTVEAIHEVLGKVRGEVTVTPGSTAELTLTYD